MCVCFVHAAMNLLRTFSFGINELMVTKSRSKKSSPSTELAFGRKKDKWDINHLNESVDGQRSCMFGLPLKTSIKSSSNSFSCRKRITWSSVDCFVSCNSISLYLGTAFPKTNQVESVQKRGRSFQLFLECDSIDLFIWVFRLHGKWSRGLFHYNGVIDM